MITRNGANRNLNPGLDSSHINKTYYNDIELRSEEIRDIFDKMPNWTIRLGSGILLFFIVTSITLSCFINYPDTFSSAVIITTQNPPEKIIAKTTGRLQTIFFKNGSFVEKNTPIAVLENPARYDDILLLKTITDTCSLQHLTFPFERFYNAQLGSVEPDFLAFQKEYSNVKWNKQYKLIETIRTSYNIEKLQKEEQLNLLKEQEKLLLEELEPKRKEIKPSQSPFQRKNNNEPQAENDNSPFLQIKENYLNLKLSISQIQSAINENKHRLFTTEINEHVKTLNMEQSAFQALLQLKKSIKKWYTTNVTFASTSGHLSYFKTGTEGRFVKAGDIVFSIIPEHRSAYVAKLKVGFENSGKLKPGQSVLIHLNTYPDSEFGVIRGVLRAISPTPDGNGHFIFDIDLPDGLVTSYHKKIDFRQEMAGTADIILDNESVFNRFLNPLKHVAKTKN